jgi:hypothetical protein
MSEYGLLAGTAQSGLSPCHCFHHRSGERTCTFLVEGRRHGQNRFRSRPLWTAHFVGTEAFANEIMSMTKCVECFLEEMGGSERTFCTAERLFGRNGWVGAYILYGGALVWKKWVGQSVHFVRRSACLEEMGGSERTFCTAERLFGCW